MIGILEEDSEDFDDDDGDEDDDDEDNEDLIRNEDGELNDSDNEDGLDPTATLNRKGIQFGVNGEDVIEEEMFSDD